MKFSPGCADEFVWVCYTGRAPRDLAAVPLSRGLCGTSNHSLRQLRTGLAGSRPVIGLRTTGPGVMPLPPLRGVYPVLPGGGGCRQGVPGAACFPPCCSLMRTLSTVYAVGSVRCGRPFTTVGSAGQRVSARVFRRLSRLQRLSRSNISPWCVHDPCASRADAAGHRTS